jgi:rod shape-determining protein MreD
MINFYPGNPQEILRPAHTGFIAFTLLFALLINLLPWSGIGLKARPDFVALVLLYWCIAEPRKIGFGIAFMLGLLMDVADGSLFGQHALAYSMLTYAGIALRRRMQQFSITPQAMHVVPLLLLNDVIVLLVRLSAGADFPGYWYFLGSVIGGLLWPAFSYLLKLPQRPRGAGDTGG